MSGSQPIWQTADTGARLQCGPLRGQVEFSDAAMRLRIDHWLGQETRGTAVLVTGGPLEKAAALTPHEIYARGCDLVVTLEKLPPHDVAPQIYLRVAELASNTVQIELVLSMRTDLLDSNPLSLVHSVVAGNRLFHCDDLAAGRFAEVQAAHERAGREETREHLHVVRNEALGWSYAEMVHPSDFVSVRAFTANAGTSCLGIESALFPERLEKGVIRRARVAGWFLAAGDDLAAAAALGRAFAASSAPLTA